MTKVCVEQPLASPRSANNYEGVYRTAPGLLMISLRGTRLSSIQFSPSFQIWTRYNLFLPSDSLACACLLQGDYVHVVYFVSVTLVHYCL